MCSVSAAPSFFGYGDLRLYLLRLLEEKPRYGYELIRLIENRFFGLYSPSAGTIYPRLSALEEEGLVEHEEVGGRKIYKLTDAGRDELRRREGETTELEDRVVTWTRDLVNEIKENVGSSLRGTFENLDLARGIDFSLGGRRRRHRYGDEPSEVTEERPVRSRAGRDGDRGLVRSLASDLDAFVSDVMAAARDEGVRDRDQLRRIQDVLLDARATAIDVLESAADDEAQAEVQAEVQTDVEAEVETDVEAEQPGTG